MLHIKTIPSIYGNGKQMKECDKHLLIVTFRSFEKNKSIPFVPICLIGVGPLSRLSQTVKVQVGGDAGFSLCGG